MFKDTKNDFVDLYNFLSEHRHIIEREEERSYNSLAKLPPEVKNSQLEINNLYRGLLFLIDKLEKGKN